MNAKIRDAQLSKVPYMLVVGDREAEADSASVRLRTGEDKGTMKLDLFLKTAKDSSTQSQATSGRRRQGYG